MLLVTRWRRLSWPERRVVLEALLLLPWAKVAVRTVRVDRLARVRPGSERGQNGVRTGSERGQTMSTGRLKVGRNCDVAGARVAELVCRVAAYSHAFTCLEVAVVAFWVVRRRGWSPVLCLGTAVEPDRFTAHAWVELDGEAVTPAGAHIPIWRSSGALEISR
jgi:hypothetical protein